MPTSTWKLILMSLVVHQAASLTTPPAQTAATTSTYSGTAAGYSLSPISYSYRFTVTTPTTLWGAPSFATSTPVSTCSESMCPALNGKQCIDSFGSIYGVLCDMRFSGVVITNSGKLKERDLNDERLEERTFTGSFDACAGFCDAYDASTCVGVAYDGRGNCMTYDSITGTFYAAGNVAALRQ